MNLIEKLLEPFREEIEWIAWIIFQEVIAFTEVFKNE